MTSSHTFLAQNPDVMDQSIYMYFPGLNQMLL